jgi:hypothetical protein
MFVSIVLSLFYFLLFLFLIYKWSFFEIEGFPKKYIVFVFGLKLIFGVILIEIYSHFYTVRSTADAFKYYDDAKVIFESLYTKPWDYFRITFGINSDAPDLFAYYQKMNNWFLADNYTIYNDSRSVIRFNALVFPFSCGRFVVHTLFMCFLSLMGLLALFKAFQASFKSKIYSLAFAVFLVPSALFWGSGVLKEGLILFTSGFLIYYFFQMLSTRFEKMRIVFLFFLFFFALIAVKIHILFSLIPGFVVLFLQYKWPQTSIYKKLLAVFFAALLFALGLSAFNDKYNPFHMLAKKQKDFINLANGGFYFERIDNTRDTFYVQERFRTQIIAARDSVNWNLTEQQVYFRWSKGILVDTLRFSSEDQSSFRLLMHLDSSGSKIEIKKLEPTFWSVISAVPSAIFNTLFRPFVFEANNLLSLFAALENLLIAFLLLLVLFFYKSPTENTQAIFVFCFSFVFILFAIIGLTTPVLGALVRYKIPALPYLFILFMILMDAEKLRKRFPFLNKIIPES